MATDQQTNLTLQNEKLALEIQALKQPRGLDERLATFIPIVTVLLGVGGFLFGVYQFNDQQQQNSEAARAADEQRQQDRLDTIRRETARPFWAKQLSTSLEILEMASVIASTDDAAERKKAEGRFWTLYWGPMGAVEDVRLRKPDEPIAVDQTVEHSVVAFGRGIDGSENISRKELQRRALDLAHAIRTSLGPTFGDIYAAKQADLREKHIAEKQ